MFGQEVFSKRREDSEHTDMSTAAMIRKLEKAVAVSLMFQGDSHSGKQFLTVPALQKHFVNILFVFAWECCIEKRRGFLVNFFWSPFPTKRSTKTPRKFGENSEQNWGRKCGPKISKIRGTFVLQLFWPTNSRISICSKFEDFGHHDRQNLPRTFGQKVTQKSLRSA